MSTALIVTIDDDPGALARLEPSWSALCDRCRFTPPFQRPEWLLTSTWSASARLSPGTLIVALVADHAAGRGLRRFDFLRGREAYKRGFGACERPRLRRVFD